ncbi:uncharacterized protein DNG_02035 [Cephalotrichum gorgonifer]|uniref:Uncharacterized protein n=1 Tax=Cephalotrichum gorgonifer TaxID=2041049 RepID=A0AAE8SSR0_9PEZI|nr:uncharacterized protein DNG_02035 [Cephalotrichum gorgonifer]
MAGKTWSKEEEDYYWTHIIPFSRRRKGLGLANPELTFKQLGEKMQAALGDKSRRVYTALCLEEHFYLNIHTGRTSKYARKHAKAYKALALKYPGVPQKTTSAMQEANDETEATHPATKPGAENDWELGGNENAEKRAAILELATLPPDDDTTPGKGKRKFEVDSGDDASPTQVSKGKRREFEPIDESSVRDSPDKAVAPITKGYMEAIAQEALESTTTNEATQSRSSEPRAEETGQTVLTRIPLGALQEAVDYVTKGTDEGEFLFYTDYASDSGRSIDSGDPEVNKAARDLTDLSHKAHGEAGSRGGGL